MCTSGDDSIFITWYFAVNARSFTHKDLPKFRPAVKFIP